MYIIVLLNHKFNDDDMVTNLFYKFALECYLF
jgi:hypothetical protein